MTDATTEAAPGTAPRTPPAGRVKPRRGPVARLARRILPWAFILVVFAVLLTLYLFTRVVVVIEAGAAGALYRVFQGGTVTDRVYGEGIHVLQPWNKMHVYNTRIQTVLHQFTVLTNKGLPITLRLAIRYHPEYEMIGLLHKRVGPDYVNTIVVPQIESVMRRNIGRQNPEDIYTNKEGILTNIVDAAIEETGQKFVFIDDVVIRAVELPVDVADAIEEKLVYQQRFEAYEFRLEEERQEAERKRIEAQGVRDYQATVRETLNAELIRWQGVQATREIAQSPNAKVVIIGAGENGLPVILGNEAFASPRAAGPEPAEPKAAAAEDDPRDLAPPAGLGSPLSAAPAAGSVR